MAEVSPPALLVLPIFIRSKEQVQKLVTEILQIDDFLNKAQVRQAGSKMTLPHTTSVLDKFAEANQRNVLNHTQRMEMAKFLRDVYKFAPVVQLFVPIGDGSAMSEGVASWFRSTVHAQTLFKLTPYPQLSGGGAIVRIKHKTYDFSLRKQFDNATPVLKEALRGGTATTSSTVPKRTQYL